MKIRIEKGIAKGSIEAPPSKSFSHRWLIGAALAKGESLIQGMAFSQDILATMDALTALGASFSVEKDTVTVKGCAGTPKATAPLLCRESGSTLRFLLPLALVSGKGAVLEGSPRLIERGIGVYQTLFAEYGIDFTVKESSISAKGQLTPSHYFVKGEVSSQFISGLLFALPLLAGNSIITVIPPVESRSYIDITLKTLSAFGIAVEETTPNTFYVKGSQTYSPITAKVEGDWSNAAFLFALNAVGGEVTVGGLEKDSVQGDKICLPYFAALERPNAILDVANCPDLAPILLAVAAAKENGAMLTGTKRLKIKESDRAAVMAEELEKMGVYLEVNENSVAVKGGRLYPPKEPLFGHNDHRIVMALAVLLTLIGGEIEGAEAISKSYPHFFGELASLGIEVKDVT